MKIIAGLALFSATSATRITRDIAGDQERRYFQLTEMFGYYNKDFDERKYWAYGCNCHILGDRPMSDPGYGPPVDPLDKVCKAYKDCVLCAKREFGQECIGEFVKYKFGYDQSGPVCKNKPNTCDRALCECDRMFAREHVKAKDEFDIKYHMFWSDTQGGYPMWDPKNDASLCPRNGGGGNPQCCSNDRQTVPYFIYNADMRDCCSDGITRPTGTC